MIESSVLRGAGAGDSQRGIPGFQHLDYRGTPLNDFRVAEEVGTPTEA